MPCTAPRPRPRRGHRTTGNSPSCSHHHRWLLQSATAPIPAPAAVCWWSRERWLAHVEVLYDTHYLRLRDAGLIPSVAKQTFMTVMGVMAADADHDTGRGCRTPVGDTRTDGTRTGLCAHTERVRRTIQRAREIARHLQILTEVSPGLRPHPR